MIPRRISEHVRAHNWFAVAIDLFVVTLGVFIGMQVQDWNSARQTRARAEEFSARLVSDLRVEAWGYEYLVEYNKDVLANADRAIKALMGERPLPDEQLVVAVYRATQYKYNERRRATYDELVSTGAIGLIADAKLRQTAISVFTNPLFDVISQEGKDSGLRKVFRETAPADIQHALLKRCGDTYVEPGDFVHIAGSLDYECSLGLASASIEAAATALKTHPALLPALKLRFADVETAITDLETNNTVVLRNLRDIARDGY
jgi:ribosomal protein S10